MDLAEKIFKRAAWYTSVLQSQLTILPGLHKDSEMDGTVVHNLDTEQTGSQIHETQAVHSSKDIWTNGISFSEVRIALLVLELFLLFFRVLW